MPKSNYEDGSEKVESFQEGIYIYSDAFARRVEELLTNPETYVELSKKFLLELISAGLKN